MSIKSIIIEDYIQDFTVSNKDKLLYGEIYSPFSLIKNMLNLFDPSIFSNADAKWLDTGSGTGYFSMILFDKLNKGLKQIILSDEERKSHIIKNMIYLIELKPENIIILKERFGQEANIIHADFLSTISFDGPISFGPISFDGPISFGPISFDYIIGNPPYNSCGMKKVPTNSKMDKKADGKTIWVEFIKKSLTLLREKTGQLCYIVPSLWMKPDKAGLYNILTSYKLEKIHCLSNTETNSLFKGEAQTPTCYFLLTNIQTNNEKHKNITLYDSNYKNYVDYYFKLGSPLPLYGQTIIQKLLPFILKAGGHIKAIKTNMPSKNTVFSYTQNDPLHPYKNIITCHLNGLQPELVVNYSDQPQAYYGEPKLVLAHKMYGFPYLDSNGTYGVSNRDNYVIKNKTIEQLKQLKSFLSSKLVLYVFESTRYRMKYLEKYAFELLPDITNLPDFPSIINDTIIANYFSLSEEDQGYINKRKNYGEFL